MWTHFMDMHSGGGAKLARAADGSVVEGDRWTSRGTEIGHIYIEAPDAEAQVIFYNRFGRNPNRVTCTCCGEDYSITQYETLEEATQYQRKSFDHRGLVPLDDYVQRSNVLVVRADEILETERHGDVPEEGYVWRD